jgi:hypothetical protein
MVEPAEVEIPLAVSLGLPDGMGVSDSVGMAPVLPDIGNSLEVEFVRGNGTVLPLLYGAEETTVVVPGVLLLVTLRAEGGMLNGAGVTGLTLKAVVLVGRYGPELDVESTWEAVELPVASVALPVEPTDDVEFEGMEGIGL